MKHHIHLIAHFYSEYIQILFQNVVFFVVANVNTTQYKNNTDVMMNQFFNNPEKTFTHTTHIHLTMVTKQNKQ